MKILLTGLVAGLACAASLPLACFILLSGLVLGGDS